MPDTDTTAVADTTTSATATIEDVEASIALAAKSYVKAFSITLIVDGVSVYVAKSA